MRILQGEVPSQIMVPTVQLGVPKFDWREIHRWGISESRLPPGSTIHYRDPTAWERYRWQILAIAAALLLQTLLIAGLFFERHRRRTAEEVSWCKKVRKCVSYFPERYPARNPRL